MAGAQLLLCTCNVMSCALWVKQTLSELSFWCIVFASQGTNFLRVPRRKTVVVVIYNEVEAQSVIVVTKLLALVILVLLMV